MIKKEKLDTTREDKGYQNLKKEDLVSTVYILMEGLNGSYSNLIDHMNSKGMLDDSLTQEQKDKKTQDYIDSLVNLEVDYNNKEKSKEHFFSYWFNHLYDALVGGIKNYARQLKIEITSDVLTKKQLAADTVKKINKQKKRVFRDIMAAPCYVSFNNFYAPQRAKLAIEFPGNSWDIMEVIFKRDKKYLGEKTAPETKLYEFQENNKHEADKKLYEILDTF